MPSFQAAFSGIPHTTALHNKTFLPTSCCTNPPNLHRISRRSPSQLDIKQENAYFHYRSIPLATTTSPRPTPSLPARKTRVPSPPPPPPAQPRYSIRLAESGELYTVADIRCEAFYGTPDDAHYYPVRRREIYMAMRDRIESGNRCLVVVDNDPPQQWIPFANENRELVVGSVDVSMHGAATGKRYKFEISHDGEGRKLYVSSMAVRREWQRKGLAQRLLACVDDMARQFGITDVFLHVEWEENAAAVHVYKKKGFCLASVEGGLVVPRWLHQLAKKEHTLMRKRIEV